MNCHLCWEDSMDVAGDAAVKRKWWRLRRISVVVMAAAIALAGGMFTLSRNVTQRDAQRLAVFEADNAKTAVTALIGQIESTMSSVGSVAAVSSGDPDAVNRLAAADPSTDLFSALAILHRSPTGGLVITSQRGTPSAPVTDLSGTKGQELATVVEHGGVRVLGFFGRGANRRLAMAAGMPVVPGGNVVYVEVPLPAGTTFQSGVPGLQYALYDGRTESSPVLFASAKVVNGAGQQVRQMVDLNDLYSSTPPKSGDAVLLFVVTSSGATVGRLSSLLPWILAFIAILAGLLVGFAIEATSRRKDQALALVTDLEEKNAELDRAMTEQALADAARSRLEGELRQAQRLEAVGRLAGGVAHDFNNLLAVILTYSDFMAEELGSDHPLQADLAEVRKAGARAADLTRKLLVFSRRDLVSPSVLDVNSTITDLMSLLHRTLGEDVLLRPALTPDLPRVLVDPGELEQVLVNLVVNARDAIVGEGTITVETSEQELDEDAARAHVDLRPGRFVRIAVTDTGCGMAPEVASQVFEPFFTTKGPGAGTGLGLSTVYGIVNRYGGYVTVYSEVGEGTTFKVYLPATDETPEPAVTDVSPHAIAATGETVLVVEDEDAVRNACRRILERAGFHVLEASNGSQVLAELSDDPVDLLLTDVIMPGGLSGRELAEQLQRDRPELRVLFMSGYSADIIATRGVLDPGVTVVEKPFSSADLLGKVRELLS
jgi:signal transduction histidine kinase/CheY-like chemotaxis protein